TPASCPQVPWILLSLEYLDGYDGPRQTYTTTPAFARCRPDSEALRRRVPTCRHRFRTNALANQNDPVSGPRHAEYTDGDLLDHVGMRRLGPKREHVTEEIGPHGLETGNLALENARAFVKPGTCLETVLARDRVMDEVGRYGQATK